MSLETSAALQRAVFDALAGAPALTAHLGDPPRVFDAPAGDAALPFAAFGGASSEIAGDGGGALETHRIALDIWSGAAGALEAKTIAAAIVAVLDGAALSLPAARLLALRLAGAEATRDEAARRTRVRLTFRALIDPD